VKEDCQNMVCGCKPPLWSIDVIDTKTGCEICQCVGGAELIPVKEVGTIWGTYCTWSPDYSCFKDGHPSCCNDKSVKCPEQRPLCDRGDGNVGTTYCSWSPDYSCFKDGHPSCCTDKSLKCPEQRPLCDRGDGNGKDDALLNLDLSSSQETPEQQVPKTPRKVMRPNNCVCPTGTGESSVLINSKSLKCMEGYKLKPDHFEHQCADGSWIDCSGPSYICMGPHGELMEPTTRKDIHSVFYNASGAMNNRLVLFLVVIGICITLFYGVQYTRKLFAAEEYTPIIEEKA